MRGAFVGRARELALLEALVSRSAALPGPTAGIVIGPPGSGKSRLVDELVGQLTGPVLRVVGYEPEQGVPLTAARDLIQALARTPRVGRRLGATAFGDQAWGQTSAPIRLFEAAHRCVRERAPLAIAIDDLQWVDPVSTALVTYLVRAGSADGVAVAVLAAGRPSAAAGSLRDALASMLPADSIHELELPPLAEPEGVALVRALAPGTAVPEAQRIWQRASGSPFWIEALAIDGDAMEGTLSRRFSSLGEDAGGLLQALAAVGRPASYTELGAALSWPSRRVRRAVEELRARGIALERSGSVEAAHDLVREAAAQGLPADTAKRLHARLARHLHQTAGADVQGLREALDHSVAAGQPTLAIAIEIARAPQRRLIGTDGLVDLARLAEPVEASDALRRELEVALAELATELGDRALELDRWVVVAEHTRGLPRARALAAAAKAAYRLGLRDRAADLIQRARMTGVSDRPVEISLDAQESEVLRWLDHRLPEARGLTDRAVAAAERMVVEAAAERRALEPRERVAAVEALQAAYDLALQEGHEPEQARIAERILELASGDLEEMEARLLLASADRRSGRMEEAEAIARRVRELAMHRVYPAVSVTAGHHLARALYSLGRMEEAERVAAEAEQLSARIGETGRFLSEIRSLRPGIAVSRGDWRTGIERLAADLEREPDPHYQLGIQQEIAIWLARLVGPPAAPGVRARVEAARACLEAVGCPRCGRELALRSAEALARIGDLEDARAALARPEARPARHSREGRLFLRQAIAALRLATGSVRAAGALARASARLSEAGNRRDALWADLDRARALAHVDRQAAIAVYRSVAERAAAGGVLTDLQVAEHGLRELGARRPPPRRRAGPLGLSRRELEIARLAAAGASNPEIASTLFLSRKTVERHISAALAKVGARNRTELASRLARIGAAGEPN